MSLFSPAPLLLVDGYNIIGSWPHLKQDRDRSSLEIARYSLIEALVNYSAFAGYTTEIVFDAHYQQTPAYRETHSPHVGSYYTDFAQTADTYIERTCAKLSRNLGARTRTIVATSDRAQQLTAVGYGAEWMSAQQLAAAVSLTSQNTRQKSHSRPKGKGRFLFDRLDPKAQERLAQMRLGIR
ncbi:MAG: NYN domain-containing protein [Cyanobacteriota bacterium]|nr:NYN domain-containing protein [Cyanobacteriota bacterium]